MFSLLFYLFYSYSSSSSPFLSVLFFSYFFLFIKVHLNSFFIQYGRRIKLNGKRDATIGGDGCRNEKEQNKHKILIIYSRHRFLISFISSSSVLPIQSQDIPKQNYPQFMCILLVTGFKEFFVYYQTNSNLIQHGFLELFSRPYHTLYSSFEFSFGFLIFSLVFRRMDEKRWN